MTRLRMTRYQLIHAPSGQSVAAVTRAGTWLAKGWGVLGRRSLPLGDGVWLPGVASVHTIGVRFALDLLFLDAELRTLRAAQDVPPGRLWVGTRGAAHVLELGTGTLARLPLPPEAGDAWRLERC